MVIEGSREYKAAQELERALNDYSWNPKRFAESTKCYHRTLQQELIKTIVRLFAWLVVRTMVQTLGIRHHTNFANG